MFCTVEHMFHGVKYKFCIVEHMFHDAEQRFYLIRKAFAKGQNACRAITF